MKKCTCLIPVCLLVAFTFFACKRVPPEYNCKMPLKKVTAYDTVSGGISYVRQYIYDQQARVDSVIEDDYTTHGQFTSRYHLHYNNKNRVDTIYISPYGYKISLYFDSLGRAASYMSPDLVAAGYAFSFNYAPQWPQPIPTYTLSSGNTKGVTTSYFLDAQQNLVKLITGTYYAGMVTVDIYQYIYSNVSNPEYNSFMAARFYDIKLGPLTTDPSMLSPVLAAHRDLKYAYATTTAATDYVYEKDACGRVRKAYVTAGGMKKLWKIYEYY
ncbi:hypothetical protein [Chitinophaga vietnamensis]|uniref:hypothetical protein n=1 Tax=Chitinophaga vietnamensis TaxID=2593957 RepID=UPI0011779D10|nr:hypothetical protein [Chitinophaga vietnamensis]